MLNTLLCLANCRIFVSTNKVINLKHIEMTTLKLETGKGLKSILIEILEPIKTRETKGSNTYRSEFEFIGTTDNPIKKIKDYGRGVYESLNIISLES